VVLSCLGIPADQCKIDGVDVQTHWKISKQWQHDFALAYVNGERHHKESLIDIPPLNEQ
jgi:iron complex outermembrane receptor protein